MRYDARLNIHEKDSVLFREAIMTSERETGFPTPMIEKDYFCTLVLDHLLSNGENRLVFKGGTCLSKVHASFYRLSEDLDFVIPMAAKASPQMRSNAFTPVKAAMESLPGRYPAFRVDDCVARTVEAIPRIFELYVDTGYYLLVLTATTPVTSFFPLYQGLSVIFHRQYHTRSCWRTNYSTAGTAMPLSAKNFIAPGW